jgi:hypothetical protein
LHAGDGKARKRVFVAAAEIDLGQILEFVRTRTVPSRIRIDFLQPESAATYRREASDETYF